MSRPLTPCLEPGCPELVERGQGRGRCPAHAQGRQRAYEQGRGTAGHRGYDAAYRRWREAILRRDPICKACGIKPSAVADHIVPIKQAPERRLEVSNGQGMCWTCHQAKRGRERHDGA